MLASEINHPLLQAVLTTDKKMFIDRNKEDTSIERIYIFPGGSPDRRTVALLLLWLTFIPRERAMRQRARSIFLTQELKADFERKTPCQLKSRQLVP